MATKEELEARLAKLEKENAALKRGAAAGAPRQPNKPIDPEKDIDNPEILAKLNMAREVAEQHDDSEDARRPLAQKVQDTLLALRELNIGYAAHGVTLIPNKSFDTKVQHDGQKPKGDLFVWGAPCHPLQVAARLVEGADVDTLTAIGAELEAKLEHEATP